MKTKNICISRARTIEMSLRKEQHILTLSNFRMNVLLLPTSIILKEILETGDLANNIVKNSSTENYSEQFKRHKIKAEHTALNVNTNSMEDYNAPFKMGGTGGLPKKIP